jgi:hypothetical protein
MEPLVEQPELFALEPTAHTPGEASIEQTRIDLLNLQKQIRSAGGDFAKIEELRAAIHTTETDLEELVRAEAARIDEDRKRSRTINSRLPDSMIDPILNQPVNVPVPLMGEYFVMLPADLALQGATPDLNRAGLVDMVAQVVERGVQTRIFAVDPLNPESSVGAGVIEERMVFPNEGQHYPKGTVFGHLGPGRSRSHPQSRLRLGMVIDDDVLIPNPDGGEPLHGHRVEFYSGVHYIASTQVWNQLSARGAPLIARQKDWMERHNQLDPGAHIEFLTTSAGAMRAGTHLDIDGEEAPRRRRRRGAEKEQQEAFFVTIDSGVLQAEKAVKDAKRREKAAMQVVIQSWPPKPLHRPVKVLEGQASLGL